MPRIKKYLYIFLGIFFLILAYIGIIVPGIPGIPFVLLAGWYFLKSSKKLYDWMLNRKYIGPLLRKYLSGENVSKGAIWFVISQLWLSIILAIFLFSLTTVFKFSIVAIGILCSFLIYKLLNRTSKKE